MDNLMKGIIDYRHETRGDKLLTINDQEMDDISLLDNEIHDQRKNASPPSSFWSCCTCDYCVEAQEYLETVTVTDCLNHFVTEPQTWFEHVCLFVLAAAFLVVSMFFCPYCVWFVLIFSCVFCQRSKTLFLIMWACIILLWLYGWRLNFGHGLSLNWD